jgi:membrane protease YdiL (CAAX protease family)
VLALVAAPIEEFVYRGVLFSGLSRSLGTLWSGLFATVVFVLAHLLEVRTYWPALFSVTLVATTLVVLRIKMKSFVPGVLCHAAYNAMVVAVVYARIATSNSRGLPLEVVLDERDGMAVRCTLGAEWIRSVARADLGTRYREFHTVQSCWGG